MPRSLSPHGAQEPSGPHRPRVETVAARAGAEEKLLLRAARICGENPRASASCPDAGFDPGHWVRGRHTKMQAYFSRKATNGKKLKCRRQRGTGEHGQQRHVTSVMTKATGAGGCGARASQSLWPSKCHTWYGDLEDRSPGVDSSCVRPKTPGAEGPHPEAWAGNDSVLALDPVPGPRWARGRERGARAAISASMKA